MSVFKMKRIILISMLMIIILGGLNYYKFFLPLKQAVPVWSGPELELEDQEAGLLSYLKPENILYQITRIRLQVPITYLKREIPLLGYYTPEGLKTPSRTVYQPEKVENRVIQLTFDLREKADLPGDSQALPGAEEPGRSEGGEGQSGGEDSRPARPPLVFIYHTHTSETYKDDPRPQDLNGHVKPGSIGNVALVGAELARYLQAYGFQVIHDTTVHDEEFMYAYLNSRKTVKGFLENNPQVDLVLDIHRNGLEGVSADRLTAVIGGKRAARIMTVVTNGRFDFANLNLGDLHPNWELNLDFGRRLAARIEEKYPGLVYRRREGLVEVTDRTYNQDLHPRALLLEMGDFNNTTAEALQSARLLADVLASFLQPFSR